MATTTTQISSKMVPLESPSQTAFFRAGFALLRTARPMTQRPKSLQDIRHLSKATIFSTRTLPNTGFLKSSLSHYNNTPSQLRCRKPSAYCCTLAPICTLVSPSYTRSSSRAPRASLRTNSAVSWLRGMKRALKGSGRIFSHDVYAKMSRVTGFPCISLC